MIAILILYILPFYYILNKWIIPKRKQSLKIGVSIILFISVIFCYGYKIPWVDKYPEIANLPDHTNKKEITIKKIKELKNFTKKDFDKFPISIIDYQCMDCNIQNKLYSKNLKNIALDNQQVISNHFNFDNPIVNGLKGIGNGGSNSRFPDETPSWNSSFYQKTKDYFKVKIGTKETIFKGINNMEYYYQLNNPKSDKDTLYFIELNTLYKAYVIYFLIRQVLSPSQVIFIV
ncbi:hypothetical protein [Chryseobacterium taiwanense]|uniref:Uncharacterized protein n=1 Tax=Chryseobacterium taiwanense TaxID=363331 RepID=A0A0B4DBE3_9FLAO|nr:hypothetical protein [Chryseobacterium taiwanense]KIC61640.1 hypothetical protein RM51_14640 [Chryseobacterium taiwanense]